MSSSSSSSLNTLPNSQYSSNVLKSYMLFTKTNKYLYLNPHFPNPNGHFSSLSFQPQISSASSGYRIPRKAFATEGDSTYTERVGNMESNRNNKVTRYAVVTGANKGIGLETVRQLALEGVEVVLSARSEKRGKEAMALLHASGLSNVVFHQLDVLDPDSISALAKFVGRAFGRLDVLINNAATTGVIVDADGLRSMNIDPESWLSGKATNIVQPMIKTTYETALECLNTNYYGCKRVAEALLPLLQLSDFGANIVNVTSLRGELRRIPNELIREELNDINTLTEDRIENILATFLDDLKQGTLEANCWQKMLPAYSISKATLNAYTRVLAKKYPKMRINCVHPGYVNTDLNWHTGPLHVEDGAKGSVMLSLLNQGGPTGCYFDQIEVAEF